MTTDASPTADLITARQAATPSHDAVRSRASAAPAYGVRRHWRRIRGPVLLYALLAAMMLTPFWPSTFRNGGDLYAIIGGIVEARSALLEKQFPIRVPPHALDGLRYPIFQFYGHAPFMAGGIIYTLLPVDPYFAWKLTVVIMLTLGATFTFLLAKRLTRRPRAAVLAGAIFMTAPYMFTDVVARGAYTEFFAFNLLPVVMYLAWRAYATPRLRYVGLSAIAWALVGLSHNITYMYGVLLIGLLFLMVFAWQAFAGVVSRRADRPRFRKLVRRLGRVVIGGIIHVTLVAWYVVPQFAVVKNLVITARFTSPLGWAFLTDLGTLLSPFAYTPLTSTTPNLTLQVGPPVMVGLVLALLAILRPRTPWRDRRVIVCLALLFAAVFVLVWSPFDVWAYLPEQLGYVQFPYRLLLFLALFGSLLTAYGVGLLLMPGPGASPRGRKVARWMLLVLLAGLGACAGTYIPRTGEYWPGIVARQVADPLMGGLEDYQIITDVVAATSAYHPDLNFAEPEWGLAGREYLPVERYLIRRPADVYVPTPRAATGLRVEGELPAQSGEGAHVVVLLGDARHVVRLPGPGPFGFSMPINFPLNGKPIRLDAYAASPEDAEHAVDVRVTKLMFESPVLDAPPVPLVQAKDLRARTRYDRRTKLKIDLPQRSHVQLPVLYYPHLLNIRVNGESVSYGNLGRFVMLDLPAGAHRIEVVFAGVGWANWVSAIGWTGVLLALIVGWIVRRRRRSAARRAALAAAGWPESGRTDIPPVPTDPNRFGPVDAIAGCAAVVLGGLAAEAAFRAAKYVKRPINVNYATDRAAAGEELALEYAFDGVPTTAWAAAGAQPIVLTLDPSKPAVLERIGLLARETSLYETWQTVHVTLSLGNKPVFEKEFHFERAHLDRLQSIPLTPTKVDRITLRFSNPVVLTPGNKRVNPALVNPGYREIELHWAKQ